MDDLLGFLRTCCHSDSAADLSGCHAANYFSYYREYDDVPSVHPISTEESKTKPCGLTTQGFYIVILLENRFNVVYRANANNSLTSLIASSGTGIAFI